jgi:hypothetical protein
LRKWFPTGGRCKNICENGFRAAEGENTFLELTIGPLSREYYEKKHRHSLTASFPLSFDATLARVGRCTASTMAGKLCINGSSLCRARGEAYG